MNEQLCHPKNRFSNILFLLTILLLVPFFISLTTSKVQAAFSCSTNGTGGGAFNSATTWTNCNSTTPQITDSITINSGDTVTLVATTTVAGITINNGGTLDATTRAITNTGPYTNNGSQTGTTSAMTLSGPSGTLISGTGSYTPTGIVTISTGDKTFTAGSNMTFANITVTGVTLTNNSTTGLSVSTALSGTGTLTQSSNTVLKLGGASLITTLNATASGNTVIYNGSGAQTVKGSTYENLTINKGGGIATLGGTTTIQATGALAITVGNLNLSTFDFTNNSTTSVTGTLSDSSATGTNLFVGLVTINSGGVWTSAGNASYTLRGGLTFNGTTFTSGNGTYTFDTNAQNITATTALTIGSITVTGITLTNQTTLGLTVSTSLSGTGTLTQDVNTLLSLGGSINISNFNAAASGNTVRYTSTTAPQTIIGTTYVNLTLVKTAQIGTLSGATNVNGDLVVTSGVLADGGFTITLKGNSTMSGSHTGSGKILFTGGTSTHVLTGVGSYTNVELDDSNGLTQAVVTTINGNLTITSGTWTASTTIAVTGSTSINGTLSITSTAGTKTFGDILINNGGVMNFLVAEAVTENGNLTINGSGSITGTTGIWTFQKVGGGGVINGTTGFTLLLASTTFTTSYSLNIPAIIPTVTITGTTLINNTTLAVTTALSGTGQLTQGSGSILNIGGTSALITIDASATPNDVHYTSTTAAQTIKPSIYFNLFIDKSGQTGTLGGLVTINGNLTVSAGNLTDGGFQITGNAIGVFTLPAGSILTLGTVASATSFPTNFITGNILLNTTSTVNYNSNLTQIISDIPNYGNLTLTATAGVAKTASGAIIINGNFTNGVNNSFADGGFTITVKGNSTMTGIHTGSGKILFIGGSTPHIVAGTGSYNNVELNDTNGVSQTAVTNIDGTLTITTGTWTASNTLAVTGDTLINGILSITSVTGTKTFGNITIDNGGTMNFTAAEAITVNGNLIVNGTGAITGITGIWTFQNVSGGTISGTASSISITSATFTTDYALSIIANISTVTITGASTELTNKTTLTVNTSLAGTGQLKQGLNTILNLGGTITITTLDASINSNEVHYTSTTANQTMKGTNYYNLFIDKAGRTATASTVTNILGNLTLSAGTLTLGGSIFTVNGTSDIHGTLSDLNNTGSGNFEGLVTVYPGGGWDGTSGESCDFNFSNGFIFNGSSFIRGGGTYTFLNNNQSISGSGAINITNLVVNNIQLTNSNTSNITITNSLTGTGSFIQDSGSTLTLNGTNTVTTFDASTPTNTVIYNGLTSQTINSGTYSTLDVSGNTSGNTNILADTHINELLALGPVNISTSTNKVIMASGSTVSRTSGYIDGNLEKNVSIGAPSLLFEVGSGGNYSPVDISFGFGNVSVSGDLIVKSIPANHPNLPTSGLITTRTVNRYWTIINNGVTFTNYAITLNFVPSDANPFVNITKLILKKLDILTWSQPIQGLITPTSIQTLNMTSFSDFVIGDIPAINTTSTTVNGAYTVGQIIPIQISFADNVFITGVPQLALNSGGVAYYISGSGTDTLTFNYTVSPGENSSDLDYTNTSALTLNGGTIQDIASNNLDLTLLSPSTPGSLGNNKDIMIDTTPPTIPTLPTTITPTNNSMPTWTWTASTDNGAGLASIPYIVQWCQDNGYIGCGGNTTTSATPSFTHTSGLADGTWYFRVKAVDLVGNVSAYSTNGQVLVDTTPPTVPTAPTTTTPTNNNMPTWTWTGSTDNGAGLAATPYTVQWCQDNSYIGCVSNTMTSITPSFTRISGLTDGTWYFRIKAVDLVGNVSAYSTSGQVLVDTTPPTIPTLPITITPTNNNMPTWTWTGSTDNGSGLAATPYTVQWCQDSGYIGCGGNTMTSITTTFTHTSSLTDGIWYFRIKAVDLAGNVTAYSTNGQVLVDTTPPTIPGTPTTTTPTNNNMPTWNWTASSDSSVGLATTPYTVQWCQDNSYIGCGANTTTSATPIFTHVSSLADGTWYFRIKAIDLVGNVSAYSTSGQVIVDTTPPVFTSLKPVTNDSINSVTNNSDISYSLSENVHDAILTIIQTSGPTDLNSPHICNLLGNSLNIGTHTIDVSDLLNGCSTPQTLVDGGVYTFIFESNDLVSNHSLIYVSTNITYDTTPPSEVTADPIPGTYISNQNVTLSSLGSSVIRYTLDESDPTCTSGTIYTQPINLSTSNVIKAVGCDIADNTTSVESFSYIINIPTQTNEGGGTSSGPVTPPTTNGGGKTTPPPVQQPALFDVLAQPSQPTVTSVSPIIIIGLLGGGLLAFILLETKRQYSEYLTTKTLWRSKMKHGTVLITKRVRKS